MKFLIRFALLIAFALLLVVLSYTEIYLYRKDLLEERPNRETYRIKPKRDSQGIYSENGLLGICPSISPLLTGHIVIPIEEKLNVEDINKTVLEPGGIYRPKHCTGHRVAIIIPYRDRKSHLEKFVAHMHPFLQKQQLDYGIYVIEQTNVAPFNRGMLLNIGFLEASYRYEYQCYVFHDVDLLPENDMNLYSCSPNPRHMAVARDFDNYRMPFEKYFGGVVSMLKEQYEQVNGYSNLYFGWGAEDDDFLYRVTLLNGFTVDRPSIFVGRYKSLKHIKAEPSKNRHKILESWRHRANKEGLHSLKYKVVETNITQFYTRILVEIPQPVGRYYRPNPFLPFEDQLQFNVTPVTENRFQEEDQFENLLSKFLHRYNRSDHHIRSGTNMIKCDFKYLIVYVLSLYVAFPCGAVASYDV